MEFVEDKIMKRLGLFFLILIVTIGIFFRTYNFHNWLTIRDDQARDASFVSQVVTGESPWPLMGAFMSFSGNGDHSEENSFHLGPIYYYFQIISARIFGDYADKLAYPDVLFGILAIPLFYFFLRAYFKRNISVGITGLFSLSSYFVQYSRFAWNTNLIPFFVLLFLFSLYKFLVEDEKTRWKWAIVLGGAIGIGVQLHVIVMAIFLLLAFCAAASSLKKNTSVWKEWALVLFLICVLNATQIVSEARTSFSNTKILFSSASHRSDVSMKKFVDLVKSDIDCHMEANAYFLSSFGSNSCTYDLLRAEVYGNQIRKGNFGTICAMVAAVVFSIWGYFLLVRSGRSEQNERKRYFLCLVSAYAVIAFLVMIPLSKEKFSDLRYFTPIFFLPFILLGLIVEYISEKFQKIGLVSAVALFFFLIYTNGAALYDQATPLLLKDRTCSSHFTTLGELEPVADYMAANSADHKLISFRGDQDLHVIYFPLAYLLKKQGIDSVELGRNFDLPQDGSPTYLISCKLGWRETYPYTMIGNFFVFRIDR